MGRSNPRPAPLPPEVKPTDPAVLEAMEKERELSRRRKGRTSTILTKSADLSGQTSGQKTMLGQ